VRVALLDPPSYTPPYDHCLAAALARRGHTVDLLASRVIHGTGPEPEGYAREDVFFPLSGRLFARAPRSRLRRPVRGLEYGPSVLALLRHLEAFEPAVAHVQWLPAPVVDLRWLRRLARRRVTVFTAHNVMLRQGPERTDLWRRIFAAVDGVVVHSQRGADRVAEFGVDRARIARIPHAVFGRAEGPRPAPPAGTTLLVFGLLRTYKGLDVLVRALAQIAPAVRDVRLVVAGYPFDPVEPVRRLADELGVADRIDWRLGHVPDADLPGLMASATLVALPYREGDASGVLATALGHGRPVVVSDVGSLGELVREFGAGEVVPPGDVDALAAACTRLVTGAGALAAAARGAEAASAALTWDAAAESHERFYEALLAARPERMAS
jgi:glycosyltransferase involved in cell wall biosynthesis